jgi:hypothetical protein
VDDVARAQGEAGGDAGLAGGAGGQGPAGGRERLAPGGAEDRPADPAAFGQGLVGRIDDRVHVLRDNVAPRQFKGGGADLVAIHGAAPFRLS